ncbi:MAG: NAD-dependent DNA ligase LigA [bacterium]
MTVAQAKKEIARLRVTINSCNYYYYVLNRPMVTDYEYDELYKKLKDLEETYPELITPDSPTQRIGGEPLKKFNTVEHKIKMLSLDNTYSENEVREFDKRIRKVLKEGVKYEVTLKVDGVAVALVFENGRLILGSTRGDGIYGDDITQNIRTIRAVPLHMMSEDILLKNIEVRGEVYLPLSSFKKLNKEREESGAPLFANPRNAAAGTLKLLSAQTVAKRGLDIFMHTIPSCPGPNFSSHYKTLKVLGDSGFKIIPYLKLCADIEQVLACIDEWVEKRDTLEYEVDGVVIKIDDFKQREILGHTIKSPRWAIAYKYPARQVITRLLDISLQVGRTGRITPVAVLQPTFLSGSTISRATLHNEDEIKRKDIRFNDYVIVEKGGEVIPKIVAVVRERRTNKQKIFRFPNSCPICKERIIRLPGEADWRCINKACPAQIKAAVFHFVSRQAMDIEGFGIKLVDQLVDLNLVKKFDDIYRLDANTLVSLERMAEKSAKNLIRSIEQSKGRSFAKVLYGLGIPNIGINSANILVQEFTDIDSMINAKAEVYVKLDGIGEIIAQSIINYFKNKKNVSVIRALGELGISFTAKRPDAETQFLKGKVFIFTGEFKKMTRIQAQNLVRRLGGHPGSSVSKKTDYLVFGANPGSKYRKAKKIGISIVSEQQFLELIEKGRLK